MTQLRLAVAMFRRFTGIAHIPLSVIPATCRWRSVSIVLLLVVVVTQVTFPQIVSAVQTTYSYGFQWGKPGNGYLLVPIGLGEDANGDVYVADMANNRVQKFSANGTYLAQWGELGSNRGEFTFPEGIAVDPVGGFVYVVDVINSRVQKFDLSGNFVDAWEFGGPGNGQFNYPQGIALASAGQVLVVDTANSRVEEFTTSGILVKAWGTKGSGNGQFNLPSGIAIDSSGNVYVADTL